jgi:hypothetical protein
VRATWRITSNKLAIAFGLVGLIVGLLPLALQAFGYELSRGQGYVVLAIIGLCVVGVIVALAWPDSHLSQGLQVERSQQRVKVIGQLQKLLSENEQAFQTWTYPFGGQTEDQGREAQEKYNALRHYYRENAPWLNQRCCQKIEALLHKTRKLLTDFAILTDPNPARRAWRIPSDPQAQAELENSIDDRALVELPELRKEIEQEFREVIR